MTKHFHRPGWWVIQPHAVLCALSLFTHVSLAGPREQALQIHNRVAGIPPTEAVLIDMAQAIAAGEAASAVETAMENEAFYSLTLKNMITPWTNRDHNLFAPLNDYSATIIGLVRDNADFRTALYDDVVYISNASGLPPYSNNNNSHYEAIQSQGVSLKNTLVKRSQSSLNELPPEATSGVITSRAAARAFFSAGTNRAMLRFTLMNHLCRDLEQVHDTSLTPDFIRQDVSRSPGGDSRVFLNNCIGCHSGMDPMAKAYAYYDYEFDPNVDPDGANGRLHYNNEGVVDPDTNSRVEKKYRINSSTFKYGYVTVNDEWHNYWRKGLNSVLGWGWNSSSLSGQGVGAKSLSVELAHTKAFATCQVEKVFQNVCLRQPGNAADRAAIEQITNHFAANNYSLKQVFIDTAIYCKGD